MAIKNEVSTACFYVIDTSTALGVTNLTSGNFTSIKLLQDNTLSSTLIPGITITDHSGGFYSFPTTAAEMNYNVVWPVVIPSSGLYQGYGIPIYTECGRVTTISGNLATLTNNVDTVSGNLDTLQVTTSGFTAPALTQIITSGNAANWNADTVNITVSGFTPGALTQIVVSGNAANWNSTSTVDTGFTIITALKELLAKSTGAITKVGDAYAYKDRDGVNLFTLTQVGDNVTRT